MMVRIGWLGTALLLTLACTVQAAMNPANAQDPRTSQEADTRRPGGADAARNDAFGSKNWRPAPPPKKVVKAKPVVAPPAVAPPPPPPAAPPIPFTYIGRMVDGKVTTVFLTHRQSSLAVKVGDVIDNIYRLEQITDSSLTLTYLPLNAQQQMSLGGPR